MQKTIKNTILYYAVRLATALLGRLPQSALKPAWRFLGGLVFLAAPTEHRIATTQLRQAFPRASKRQVRAITRGICNHLSRNLIELCRLMHCVDTLPEVIIPQESLQTLTTLLAQQKGLIFITGHLGNWELMAIALARHFPIFTVARESYDPRFTRFIEGRRAAFGVHAIYRNRKGAVLSMVRALRSGAVLGFLIDQDTSVAGVHCPFFGRPAFTPSGPAAIALRTATPMVVGTLKRTTRGQHRLHLEAVPPAADIRTTTAHLTGLLETRVRGQISQWVWFHRRWKTLPPREGDTP